MSGVADILRRAATEHGDVVAMRVDGGDRIDYRALDQRSSRWSQALIALGVGKGARVAVMADNAHGIDVLTAYFACHKLGAVYVGLSPRAAALEQRAILEHAEASLLIARDGAAPKGCAVVRPKMLDLGAGAHDPRVAISDDDLAEIVYTSGTTGRQKGVAVSHGSLTALDTRVYAAMLAGTTFLHPLPLGTFAGLTYMLWCVRVAMTNLLMASFDPHRFVDLLEREPVTSTYAVSSMWLLALKQVGELRARRFETLRFVQYGAAPMPPSAVLDLCDAFPEAMVMSIYGLTEGGSAGCVTPPGAARQKPASVGKPLPHTEVRIASDDGVALSVGERGEIWLRSKLGHARHYHRDPSASDAAWHDGWLRTGDIGFVDDDGFVHLVDRKKDIVIRGGHNIASLEVEDALYLHPAVEQAAVIGVPHEVLGEDLVAFVVVSSPVDGEALRAHLLERLADYKVPRRYVPCEALPRNASGKILKRALRERATEPAPAAVPRRSSA